MLRSETTEGVPDVTFSLRGPDAGLTKRIIFREALAKHVEANTGLKFPGATLDVLEQSALRRARKLRLADEGGYLRLLKNDGNEGQLELRKLISRVTVSETYFYRDHSQCEAISEIFRQLFQRRQRPLEVWSAGCATGEEAFTLVMLAAQAGVEVRVLGTDIDPEALAAARQAIYGTWKLRRLPEGLRKRFLQEEKGGHRVVESVRAAVKFEEHNLLDAAPSSSLGHGLWDVILCRNVFIYFHGPTSVGVAHRCLEALAPEGWFFTAPGDYLRCRELRAALQSLPGTLAYQPAASPTLQPAWEFSGPADDKLGPALELSSEKGLKTALPWSEEPLSLSPSPELSELSTTGLEPAAEVIEEGRSLVEAGRSEEALEVLREAESLHPLVPEIHYWIALAHRQLAGFQAYEEALRRTLFLAPEFWPAAYLLGTYLEERRELEEAVVAYRQVISACSEGIRPRLRQVRPQELGPLGFDAAAACRRRIERLRAGRLPEPMTVLK